MTFNIQKLLQQAIDIAFKAHYGQIDKSGKVYISHPARVMDRMKTAGDKIVAILHDVIEDTEVTSEELAKTFPSYLVASIKALSQGEHESLEDYISRVKVNPCALRVKREDIRDNLNPWRLKELDLQTQERLKAKYAKARALLEE